MKLIVAFYESKILYAMLHTRLQCISKTYERIVDQTKGKDEKSFGISYVQTEILHMRYYTSNIK